MEQTLTNLADSELEALVKEIGAVFQEPKPGQLRAVAYLRVSTEDQKQGFGLSYTGKRVIKHIAKKGHALVGIYADGGFSGSLEAHERPDLTRLMEAARQPTTPFDIVAVAEARAIGRRDRAFWPWVWELEDLGVYTAVVKGDYDNTTNEGRSRMRKDADRAEDERETIRDRTQGGLQEKAEDGGYTGGFVPFGYMVENQGIKGASKLILNPADVPTLRRGREVFVKLKSWPETEAVLNAERLFSQSGKPWKYQNLQKVMLGDAVLNSRIVFRKSKKAKLDRAGKPLYGESVVIDLPPVFTPEEADELYEAAELVKKGPPVKRGRIYILSNRLVARCGYKYVGHRKNGKVPGYRCNGSASAGGPGCNCPFLEAEVTENAVWVKVCEALGDADRLHEIAQDWTGVNAGQNINHAERLLDLDKQISNLRRTKNLTLSMSVRDAVAEGASDAEAEKMAAAAVQPFTDELASLTKLRNETAAWQAETEAAGQRAKDLLKMAETAHKRLENLAPVQKQRLLELLDTVVTVKRDAPKGRQGTACSLASWFRDRDKTVPELTDDNWESVSHLFPKLRKHDARQVVAGLLHKARTGVQWTQLPAEYGNGGGVHTHWVRWSKTGLWEQAMALLDGAAGQEPFRPWTSPSMSIRTWVIPELLLDTEQNLAGGLRSRASRT
ncbi:recombinase family protein [Streptomyces sp. NBC_01003]|uniref:recombinase family protein n=1 Tax=Streptomyces sp. NBC_01003 TaxID=2903714 RepID=UPI0038685458|nr:recombinase family protein [Streptomyces sp. NBC_01003]